VGHARVGGDCLTNQIDGDVISPLLVRQHTKIVQRSDVFRLMGEDMPINLLGLLQASGLMVLQCQIEGVLNRDLLHT